jgi:hypothetical protein
MHRVRALSLRNAWRERNATRSRTRRGRVISPPVLSDETKNGCQKGMSQGPRFPEAISHYRSGRHSSAVCQIPHRSSDTVVK